jgi:nucleotide-binding universal stress UspA family protein
MQRVVVGGSDAPANAYTLGWAVAEAASTGAELVVVRADEHRREVWGAVARNSLPALEVVDRHLAGAVAGARFRLGENRVRIVVDRHPPGELLIRRAGPGDLLVLGPPRHAGWWARGSTTYAAVTRGPCPVVVVHAPPAAGRGHLFSGHVVVGVDGSPAARAALGFGFAYADEHGLPLVAVTAGRQAENEVWFDDQLPGSHLFDEPEEARTLAAEVEPWHQRFPSVEVRRALVAGPPAEALRRAGHDAHLLVVGTAGTGPADLGSVSRALIDDAPVPVAVIRESS